MIRRLSILCCILLFSNCKREVNEKKLDYNQKANELIQQVILHESCNCISEIPQESVIKTNLEDMPMRDIRKEVISRLYLRDRKELDSLESLSSNFILDSGFFKRHNITILKNQALRKLIKNYPDFDKKCPNGVLFISKPIFNKRYTRAFMKCSEGFTCIPSITPIYTFRDGKWE